MRPQTPKDNNDSPICALSAFGLKPEDMIGAWVKTASRHVGVIVGVMTNDLTGAVTVYTKLCPAPKFRGVMPKEFVLCSKFEEAVHWDFYQTRDEAENGKAKR